ncbi:toprim domain-containing protein [Limosilactobacillus reuteri]|uniref:toprim domain-containing protein n=1 Tax=Limosilactobacillus reuteri TaxID=1598 RepID=UPI0039BFB953
MFDYLILTEKKSAFDNFVAALGGETGTVNGHTYQLTHAQGHLLEFLDPVDQVAPNLKDKYESWELKDLPWNLQDLTWRKKAKNGSAQKMIKKIANESRQAQAIVIATDNDPSGEGELLAWEIINAINWRGPVYREYHDDESKKGIQKALRNLRDISSQKKDGDYIKAVLRQRWDFASMQATRVSTTLARSEGYRVKVINQGRLKSVMLAFTFDQLQRIKHYQKKPYYEVKFKDNNGHVYARKVRKEDEELSQPPLTKVSGL